MKKTLKFEPHLVNLILTGEKTATWRLFDDKSLKAGDEVEFLNSETTQLFANARLTAVKEKAFSDLDDSDWHGHEKFASIQDMYAHYSKLYNTNVKPDTLVKIIAFELLK